MRMVKVPPQGPVWTGVGATGPWNGETLSRASSPAKYRQQKVAIRGAAPDAGDTGRRKARSHFALGHLGEVILGGAIY